MPKNITRFQKDMAANAARRKLIIKLYSVDGMKKADIARMIGMSRSRVGTIIKESGIDDHQEPAS